METALYAIVNSICDTCDVEAVRIRIEGSGNALFRDEIPLAQVFEMDIDSFADEDADGTGSVSSGISVSSADVEGDAKGE